MTRIVLERRAILTVAAASLLAFIAAEIVVAQPQRRAVRDLRQKVEEKSRRLQGGGWPLEASRLEPLATERERRRVTASRQRDAVLAVATSLFNATRRASGRPPAPSTRPASVSAARSPGWITRRSFSGSNAN